MEGLRFNVLVRDSVSTLFKSKGSPFRLIVCLCPRDPKRGPQEVIQNRSVGHEFFGKDGKQGLFYSNLNQDPRVVTLPELISEGTDKLKPRYKINFDVIIVLTSLPTNTGPFLQSHFYSSRSSLYSPFLYVFMFLYVCFPLSLFFVCLFFPSIVSSVPFYD